MSVRLAAIDEPESEGERRLIEKLKGAFLAGLQV